MLKKGVFAPPEAVLILSGTVIGGTIVPVHIHSVQKLAGAGIGTAVVSYPLKYADGLNLEMGKAARITLDGTTIFRGVVGDAIIEIDADTDEVKLVLYDDKWRIARKTIGQIDVGTQGNYWGFKDVGFDLIFNRDSRPNMVSGGLDFCNGSSAQWWTLKLMMKFIFTYFVDAGTATVADAQLGTNYDKMPSHVNLSGMTALQAIDTIAAIAGESWGLTPGATKSEFAACKAGSGTSRYIVLNEPKDAAQADSANEWWASRIAVNRSIRNCKDTFHAVSGNVIKEQTYSNKGASALLTRVSGFKDKEYVARFKVNVLNYYANGLGGNFSTNATPKKWLSTLVTRTSLDGASYLAAVAVASNPELRHNPSVSKPLFWLSLDGTTAKAKLCVGGYRVDTTGCYVDLKAEVELMNDSVDPSYHNTTNVASLSGLLDTIGIWLTIATELEYPDFKKTAAASQYLQEANYQVIKKNDLVPEKRQSVWLPDLTSANPNDVTEVAASEEKYVDVDTELQAAIDNALVASPAEERQIEIDLPFIPLINIGDKLVLRGRDLDLTGNEVFTEISFDINESYNVRCRATNVTGAVGGAE